MNDDTNDETIELPPLKSANDGAEFEDTVLKGPDGAEYIRTEDED